MGNCWVGGWEGHLGLNDYMKGAEKETLKDNADTIYYESKSYSENFNWLAPI